MGIKNNQLATALGVHPPTQYGSSQMVLAPGDNIVVPTVPAGKTRIVSLVSQPNTSLAYNYDNISHDIFYKIGSTVVSLTVTVPSGSQSLPVDDNFQQLQALTLTAGETLVLNLATAINIAGSVTASFSWCDLPADTVVAPRVNIPSTSPIVLVAAPPAGKARRIEVFEEGFSANGYFFNGDAGSVDLIVEVAVSGTPVVQSVLDINPITILSGRGLQLFATFGLTGNQALRAYLGSTPAVPLKFYGVYKEFPKTA